MGQPNGPPSAIPEGIAPQEQVTRALPDRSPCQASQITPGAPNVWRNMTSQPASDGLFESFRRAEMLIARSRPLDALQALGPVLESQPNDVSVQLLAGRAYLNSAQLRRAEDAFSRVLDLDPADHYARFALGKALQRQVMRDDNACLPGLLGNEDIRHERDSQAFFRRAQQHRVLLEAP